MFGFNPRDFSDEELVERISELARRIVWSSRMGHSSVADQLRTQQRMCEQEQRDRATAPRFNKMMSASPIAVETDPDLAREAREAQEAKIESELPKRGTRAKPFAVTRERVKPTSRPTGDN